MRPFIERMLWDPRGTSTIELAIMLPIGLALILGAVDASMAFAQKLRVETAAARTIEQITAFSQVQTDYSTSVAEAAAAANVPVSDVTATLWLECNNVRQADYTADCPNSSDQIARFVNIGIRGKFKPSINYGQFLKTDAGGYLPIYGEASVRIQ